MPRAGLSEERVVEEAERLVDEVGLSQLTLGALAERLNVRQPSLYKHIAGMDGLKRSISIRAKREMTNVFARAAIGKSQGDAIRAFSVAYRTWAREHPGRYEAAQRAPVLGDADDEAVSTDVVRIVFDVIGAYGLRDDDAVHAVRIVRSILHGFVTLEAGGGFSLPTDITVSFSHLVVVIGTILSSWNEPTRKVR